MGDRYFLTVTCPKCSFYDDDVYYAPTCGFKSWRCEKCGQIVDLAEYTGISEEDASNKIEIEEIVKQYDLKYKIEKDKKLKD